MESISSLPWMASPMSSLDVTLDTTLDTTKTEIDLDDSEDGTGHS